VTTPQEPGDREQPTPFPSAPPPPPEQLPPTPYQGEVEPNVLSAPPLSASEIGGGAPVGEAPKELRIAFFLWLGVAFLHFVAAVLAIASHGSLADVLRQSGQGLTEEQITAAASVVVAVVAVIDIVFAALFTWFSLKVKAGRGWARTLLMIFGAVSVFAGLVTLSSLLLLILIVALVVAGFVMLNLRPTSEFITAQRRA